MEKTDKNPQVLHVEQKKQKKVIKHLGYLSTHSCENDKTSAISKQINSLLPNAAMDKFCLLKKKTFPGKSFRFKDENRSCWEY